MSPNQEKKSGLAIKSGVVKSGKINIINETKEIWMINSKCC